MLTQEHCEEASLFAARRAFASDTIGQAFVETLRRLCQSDRAAIRDHAIRLAHNAAAAEWARRQGGGKGAA